MCQSRLRQCSCWPCDPTSTNNPVCRPRCRYSFAVVIQQLPNPLRDAICIFYLVLRGLDTVEDDMAIPEQDKLPQLRQFHDNIWDRCVCV